MKLLPCPFCGAEPPPPEDQNYVSVGMFWAFHEQRLSPRPDGKTPALVSVRVLHWCGNGNRTRIEVTGRDHDDAGRQWNRRAP